MQKNELHRSCEQGDLEAVRKLVEIDQCRLDQSHDESDDLEEKLNFRLKAIRTFKTIPSLYRQHVVGYYENYLDCVGCLAHFLEKHLPPEDARYLEIARMVKKECLYVVHHALGTIPISEPRYFWLTEDLKGINDVLVAVSQKFPNDSLDEQDLAETCKTTPAAPDSPKSKRHTAKRRYPSFYEKRNKHLRSEADPEQLQNEISAPQQ